MDALEEDDWGPALPSQPAPTTPNYEAAGPPPPPPALTEPSGIGSTYSRPLSEDPVYLAALQQAAAASGCAVLPPASTSSQPHSQPSYTPPPPPPPRNTPAAKSSTTKPAGKQGGPLLASALAAATKSSPPIPSSSKAGHASTHSGSGFEPSTSPNSAGGAGKPGHERVNRGRKGAKQLAAEQAAAEQAGNGAAVATGDNGVHSTAAAAAGAGERAPGGSSAQPPRNGERGRKDREGAPQPPSGVPPQQQRQQQQAQGARSAGGGAPAASAKAQNDDRRQAHARLPEYLPQEQLQIMFKRGLAFKGRFRVNASDPREAYLTVPGFPHDCLIRGERAQNRAMEGDEVAVQLLPVSRWFKCFSKMPEGTDLERDGSIPDDAPWRDAENPAQAIAAVNAAVQAAPPGALRISGQVVAILEPSARREQLVGIVQANTAGLMVGGSPLHFFLPLAPTMPKCVVAATSVRELPEELQVEAAQPPDDDTASRTLLSARVLRWDINNDAPLVELRQSLGQAGEIESETAAILEIEGIRRVDFSPEVEECLPPVPWRGITDEDLVHRRDFRGSRVFSIDPPTAKDLDDAMHIEPVEGIPGRWRVGVHIADVSHFIPPDSALDAEAQERATSVYLVQRVIPMLPRLLCEELCSLNPGTPRFSFSVEWEMDEQGHIFSQWAGKSVICSAAKLAYPTVQSMIEGCFNPADCSALLYGEQSWDAIVSDCLALHRIAQSLRAARHASGAVRLDNVRMAFGLDKDGNPVSCGQYVQKDANKLIEEFMLLTNISVAKIISRTFPDRAMLRNHVAPQRNKIEEMLAVCQAHGIPMDASSSGALQASLNNLRATVEDQGIVDVITMMATKPMQLAKYFCTGDLTDPEEWRHYALALPEYTHFTSPIRRYPDLVVHRQLSAALELIREAQQPDGQRVSSQEVARRHQLWDTQRTAMVADHCNEKRLTARNAQDASLKLYLCVILRRSPTVTEGIVTNVNGNRFFEVYLTGYGISTRIQVDQLGVDVDSHWSEESRTLTLQLKNSSAPSSSTSNTSNRRQGFGNSNSKSSSNNNNNNNKANQGLGAKTMEYGAWLSGLPSLSNPDGMSPVQMPLTVKMFAHLPLIATSPLVPGKVSQVFCRLLLHSAQVPTAPATTTPEEIRPVGPDEAAELAYD